MSLGHPSWCDLKAGRKAPGLGRDWKTHQQGALCTLRPVLSKECLNGAAPCECRRGGHKHTHRGGGRHLIWYCFGGVPKGVIDGCLSVWELATTGAFFIPVLLPGVRGVGGCSVLCVSLTSCLELQLWGTLLVFLRKALEQCPPGQLFCIQTQPCRFPAGGHSGIPLSPPLQGLTVADYPASG